MGSYTLKYSSYGRSAILVEWPSQIDENILYDILNFKNRLQNEYIKPKLEIINTYNSLLIKYEFTIDNFNDKIIELKSLYSTLKSTSERKANLWRVPVCYEDNFATDLDYLSHEKKTSKEELIALHTRPVYTVFFIGFLPGFLYLGGLDKRLHFDRKKTPNPSIKKGAVAIGGNQTGIYPQESPGGWHIIGNSPLDFFNPKLKEPCFAKPGDKIQFVPISFQEHQHILQEVTRGDYDLKPEVYHG